MRINKLQTLDFQGLSGKREFTFDKVTVLCQANQSGKSSLLNAIKYGLTGQEPEGELVFSGRPKAAVGMELEDGTQIIRQKQAGGTSSAYLSRHKTTKKLLDQAITDASGVPTDAMKIVSSEEVLRTTSPQKLMDIMLGYTADQLDIPTVASFIPDVTEEMKDELKKRLPDELFGINTIHAFAKKLNEDRLELKRAINDRNAAVKAFREVPKPAKTKDELVADEQKALASVAESAAYKEKLVAYNKAKVDIENQKKKTEEYQTLIKDIKAENRPDSEREALEKGVKDDRELLDSVKKSFSTFEKTAADTTKILNNINTTLCPLSDKLVCTTDKTKVTDELKEILKTAEEGMKTNEETIDTLSKKIAESEKKVREFDSEREAYKRKEFLITELEKLKAQVIELPEAPKKPEMENANEMLKLIRKDLQTWDNYERADRIEKNVNAAMPKLEMFEYLTKAFGDKGPVMERIVERYMTAFEEACNEKAAKLGLNGMRVKFVAKSGVKAYIDTKGTGIYLGYESLSGGEKAVYIYLMLDMLNALSGLRILILDELSVLDKETFDALLSLIMEHKDDYDQIFLAMVNHEDTVETIAKYGIEPYKL